jgi:ABC-2 type transport system ATP-binding protein
VPIPDALRLCGLRKVYGDVVALDGLDLEVAAGECVALIGHNGSGKTTAVRLAAGQLQPTAGTVTVAGIEVTGKADVPEARARLAFVPDTPVLYGDLTVGEHLELVALAHGIGDPAAERIAALLAELGLAGRREFLPGQLSRGLRQKTSWPARCCGPSRCCCWMNRWSAWTRRPSRRCAGCCARPPPGAPRWC